MPTPPPDQRLPPGISWIGWIGWGTTFGWCPVCGIKPNFIDDIVHLGCRLEPHGREIQSASNGTFDWRWCPGSGFVVPYTADVCGICNMPCSVPEQFCRLHGRCVECCTCDESAAACQRFVVDRWQRGYLDRFRADRTPGARIAAAYRHAYNDELAQERASAAHLSIDEGLHPAGYERVHAAQYTFFFDYDMTHDPE